MTNAGAREAAGTNILEESGMGFPFCRHLFQDGVATQQLLHLLLWTASPHTTTKYIYSIACETTLVSPHLRISPTKLQNSFWMHLPEQSMFLRAQHATAMSRSAVWRHQMDPVQAVTLSCNMSPWSFHRGTSGGELIHLTNRIRLYYLLPNSHCSPLLHPLTPCF